MIRYSVRADAPTTTEDVPRSVANPRRTQIGPDGNATSAQSTVTGD